LANEGHLNHPGKVLGCLLEAAEYPPAFFEPTNQPFDDVPAAVCLSVKLDWTGVSVFVRLGGNNRLDSESQQRFVNPVRTICLVTCQCHRPGDWLAITISNLLVSTFQHHEQGRGFVLFSRSKVEVKWMTITIAQQMDFRGKTAAGSA